MAALRSLEPDIRISALGGPGHGRGRRPGSFATPRNWPSWDSRRWVSALPAVLRARQKLFRFLSDEKPDLVIPIDFPGFNGQLAGKAQQLGLPVYWLIAPQVWAWGGWRTGGYRKKIQRLGTILPFEEEFFRQRGFDVFPMGHPLSEDYMGSFPFEDSLDRPREKLFHSRQEPLVVGIIPGSRRQELKELLPILKVTSQALVGTFREPGSAFHSERRAGGGPLAN